jgi:hypothetical protein
MASLDGPMVRPHNLNHARMFGKAVKFRHCPATVSAVRQATVVIESRMK